MDASWSTEFRCERRHVWMCVRKVLCNADGLMWRGSSQGTTLDGGWIWGTDTYFAGFLKQKADWDSLTNHFYPLALPLIWPSHVYGRYRLFVLYGRISFCRSNLGIKDLTASFTALFTFSIKLLSLIGESIFFMPLIISVSPLLLSPSLCRGGMQWVGATFLERCEVASSPFTLISQPCFCHHGDATFGLVTVIPKRNPLDLGQINKAVFLLALICCFLPVAALLLCFGAGVMDSVGWVVQSTTLIPPCCAEAELSLCD